MADAIVTKGETVQKDEPPVAEEFDNTDQEFRALYDRCDEDSARMKQLAMSLQPSAPQAAEALRQIAGNVYPLMQEVIATCGGAFQSLEELSDEEGAGEGLGDEDALDFARTLIANNKIIAELITVSTDTELTDRLGAVKAMNDEMLARVLELADMTEQDLEQALGEEASEPGSEEEAN